MKAMGKELGISRQAVKWRLERRGLDGVAAIARARHGVYGVQLDVLPNERGRVVRALGKFSTFVEAARSLGIHPNRLRRRIRKFEITDEEIDQARAG